MPRQAHGLPVSGSAPSKPAKRKAAKPQYHNALEIAEKQNPTRTKIQQHRLGDVEDDSDQPKSRVDTDDRSSKRRKVSNDLDDEHELMEGSDGDGNQWHIGVDEDDEDSDIDSDEAFGESDEERFAGYTFRGSAAEQTRESDKPSKRRKQPPRQELDLSEGEEGVDLGGFGDEEEDDFGDEGIDLAAALDLNEEEDRREQEKLKLANRRTGVNAAPSSEEGMSEDEDGPSEFSNDEDGESQLSVSGDEDSGGHSKLQSFLEGLGGTSAGEALPGKSGTSKTVESRLRSSKLTAADLLQYVKDPRQRQSLKVLNNSEKTGPERYQGGVPGKLEPPLAKRQQDRLDRLAAYDKSKETLNRWIETVKQNRRAEHISFPLQDPNLSSGMSSAHLAPTSQSQPITPLESVIQEIMQESGLASKNGPSAEEQERAFEELQEKKMPIEEVQARHAELRMARDLLFREEVRARRIKKIKSKAYRRVHRRERDKAALEERAYLTAAGMVDSDDERERSDRLRAEERMGARHRESKWAKSVKATGRAAWDEDARHAVSDLARRDDELRKRIEGKTVRDSDQSDHDSTSDSGDENSSAGNDDFRGFDEKIDRLEEQSFPQTSGLGSMAFMQRAEAARKVTNDAEIRELRRTIHGEVEGEEEEKEAESTGRLQFGTRKNASIAPPRARNGKREFEERLSEDENSQGSEAPPEDTARNAANAKSNVTANSQQPSLHAAGQAATIVKAPRGVPINKKERGIQLTTQAPKQEAHTRQAVDDLTSDSGSESDDGASLDLNDNAALAKSLFAGDDTVRRDFDKEKRETIEEEGDQVIDHTLPGWGSWAGAGVSKREQKRAQGHFVTTIKGVSEEQRKDAKLARVIVNEKRVKKNGKYLASELPHPFESRQQYERSLRLPIGPEWTTKSTFQDATKPRLLMKQGIIRPIARPIA